MQFGFTMKPDISVESVVALPARLRVPDLNTAGSSIRTFCGKNPTRC